MKHTPEQTRTKLVNDLQYQEKQVDTVVSKLFNMNIELQIAFDTWLETGNLPDYPVYEKFSPRLAWETYQLKPPAIFLLLDWISREPTEALSALMEDYGTNTPQNSVR